ncbi:MAG: hypothetical protein IKZ84_02760 [Victivallales bacterium]|nr:hypothetical protein [Victivallales bacterium]
MSKHSSLLCLLLLTSTILAQPKTMHKINIAPLLVNHAEEITADIVSLYHDKVIDSVAFSFTLVPEGVPPVDKAAEYTRRFKIFQKLLKEKGVPTGILIQATWGHGWVPDSPTNFQQIRRIDGNHQYTMCPEGEPFRDYVRKAIMTAAAAQPDFFMLDDDTRFITGRSACFCPLHTALFNQKTGRNLTSDQLREAVKSSKEDAHIMDDILQESMVKYAHLIRDSIDAVNLDIPCSFCLCSQDVRHAPAVAKILAGQTGEAVIRINNARYLQDSLRNIPTWLHFTATQVAAFDDDVTLICEPDTFPQNRYSTSAATLRMHMLMSALEGCKGGKFWITRMSSFEPNSGKAYREALAGVSNQLEAIYAMKPQWSGICIPMPSKPVFNYPTSPTIGGWHETFGRMGLPIYFSKKPGNAVALSGLQVNVLSDDDIKELFKRNVLIDGSAAIALTRRGLADLCGCTAAPWSLEHVTYEQADGEEIMPFNNSGIALLKPSDGTTILTNLYHRAFIFDAEQKKLAPGALLYEKPDGTSVITIAHYYGWNDGLPSFGMFNETRKKLFVKYLQKLNAIPIWHPDDAEILLKAAILPDGSRIAFALNIGLDVLNELPLTGPWTQNNAVQQLNTNGEWQPVASTRRQDGALAIQLQLPPLGLAILKF